MEIELIYKTHYNDLYHYLYSLTHHFADAEDILQETFVKAYPALLSEDIRDIRPFLFKVAYHAWIDRTRKKKREHLTNEIFLPDAITPEDQVAQRDSFLKLVGLLEHIRPAEKQAILLCDVHDCTLEQAADILHLKLNTVKSHLFRGRRKLRKLLEEEIGWTRTKS